MPFTETAGCGVLESFDPEIDAVGRQIAADWKKLPAVAAAQYEYRHGLDAGQSMTVEVMLHADKVAAADEAIEIARRDYWRGTWQNFGVGYLVYSTDDPPYADKPESGKPFRSGKVDLTDTLEASYGPRPTRPSK